MAGVRAESSAQFSENRGLSPIFCSGADFLHLLLRHVLPKGLRRARNFGFLHPNSKRLIQLLHLLFRINPGRAAAAIRPRPALACLDCGGAMRIVRTRIMPTPSGSDRPTDVTAGAMPM
ncbi:MAG: transposase [Gammaproteobacteria bacterium]